MMGLLYDVDARTISYHLKKIFNDNELAENSVIQNFWITADDGKNYQTKHYNLSAIIHSQHTVSMQTALKHWIDKGVVERLEINAVDVKWKFKDNELKTQSSLRKVYAVYSSNTP